MQQERSTRGFSFLFRCCRSIYSSFFRHALKASFFRHAPAKPRLVAVLSFKLRFTRFQQVLTASHCLQKEDWRAWLVPLYIAFKKKLGEHGWYLSILPSKRTLDRTATFGHGWHLHIAFKKKLGEGGRRLTLPSKRTLDRTATVGRGWCLILPSKRNSNRAAGI